MLRELTPEEMVAMLQNHSVGRLGCHDGEITYVVPVGYVWDQNTLLCHSLDGMKINMMRRNASVCFEVDEIFSFNHWRCIIAWGDYLELTEEADIEYAREVFSDYLLTTKNTMSAKPPHASEERFHDVKPDYVPTIFYRIVLNRITGRYEQPL
jgi:uncharacterized protein